MPDALEAVTLDAVFATITEYWSPVVVAELNGQQVKAAKFLGPFHWHQHTNEDELFLVHRGQFRMEFRDRTVELRAGVDAQRGGPFRDRPFVATSVRTQLTSALRPNPSGRP